MNRMYVVAVDEILCNYQLNPFDLNNFDVSCPFYV